MRRLFLAIVLLAFACNACTKDEGCSESTRIYVSEGLVLQDFEDGSTVVLGVAGELYTPFDNTCEL